MIQQAPSSASRATPTAHVHVLSQGKKGALFPFLSTFLQTLCRIQRVVSKKTLISIDSNVSFFCKSDFVFCKSDFVFCKSDSVFCKSNSVICKSDSVFCKSDSVFCKSDFVFCKSDMDF